MLRSNDKFNLVVTNFFGKDEVVKPIVVPFPLEEEIKDMPLDVLGASVMEYHEDTQCSGFTSFNIYVGKVSDLYEMMNSNKDIKLTDKAFRELSSIKEPVCYYEDRNNKSVVFSVIGKNDIVVPNIDEFNRTLFSISDNYNDINKGICRIRNMRYIKEDK